MADHSLLAKVPWTKEKMKTVITGRAAYNPPLVKYFITLAVCVNTAK